MIVRLACCAMLVGLPALVGAACARPRAAPTVSANPDCVDPHDPQPSLQRDSITAGLTAIDVRFYRSDSGEPLGFVSLGSIVPPYGGRADALGHLRLLLSVAGQQILETRRIGLKSRRDSVLVPADSVVWLRIGLARSMLRIEHCLGNVHVTQETPAGR